MYKGLWGASRRHSRGAKEQRGAAAVEFALVATIFISLVMGIIQYGYYFYAANSATAAAREGARRLVVGDCWTGFDAFVKSQAPAITSGDYSPSLPGSVNVGEPITVTVKANGALISFFPWGPSGGEVTRTFTARLEDKTAGSCS